MGFSVCLHGIAVCPAPRRKTALCCKVRPVGHVVARPVVIHYLHGTVFSQICSQFFRAFICTVIRINTQFIRFYAESLTSTGIKIDYRLISRRGSRDSDRPCARPVPVPCDLRGICLTAYRDDGGVAFGAGSLVSYLFAVRSRRSRFDFIAGIVFPVAAGGRGGNRPGRPYLYLYGLRSKTALRRRFPHINIIFLVRVSICKHPCGIGFTPVGVFSLFHKDKLIFLAIIRLWHRYRRTVPFNRSFIRRSRRGGSGRNLDLRLFVAAGILDLDGRPRFHGQGTVLI